MQRRFANEEGPSIKISTTGTNKYTIESTTGDKTLKADFELGKPFEQEIFDGRKADSLVVAEGGDLVEKQIIDRTHSDTLWHVDGTKLVATYKISDVTAVRKFDRQ